ncbi:MAG: HAMP domain-containing protein [Thiothrix sp.]|nr:HAMP domain-containing protein [Thiothrix sp.]HPE62237.1 ATP-binding protein [Thiolinea sp.]
MLKSRMGIRGKLFIAIFLACLLTIGLSAGIYQLRVKQAFQDFIQQLESTLTDSLARQVELYYAQSQSLAPLKNPDAWRMVLRESFQLARQSMNESPPPGGERGPSWRMSRRLLLMDARRQPIQGHLQDVPPARMIALHYRQQVIGYLHLYPPPESDDNRESRHFMERLRTTALFSTLVTLLTSLLIALLLSRQMVKPIQRLRNSTRELANGNYQSRVKIQGSDELGQLSHDFNQLAARLQENEQARQQWIMDIAHELRTPLSVLRGEIEAIQDGISHPDEPTIHSLHQETLHLQRLVEDLYHLSMSDNGALTYHKTELDLPALLRSCTEQFEPLFQEQQLDLQMELPRQAVFFNGDPQRLQQLFHNLLQNSLRYTDKPGQLQIRLAADNRSICIEFQDSAPGVPDEALPRLFERLYRVESSRNRATGGAGIGLSLCHNIVKAHEGRISATHAALGGLRILIVFPAADNTRQS